MKRLAFVDPSLLNFINNVTPLGLLAFVIALLFYVAFLLIRDRKREREAQTAIAIAKETTIQKRDEATQERERAFFTSIASINDFVGAIRKLVDENAERHEQVLAQNTEMIRTLQSMTEKMLAFGVQMDTNYALLVTGQDSLITRQTAFERLLADDVTTAKTMSTELGEVNVNVNKAIVMLGRVEVALSQMTSELRAIVASSDHVVEKERLS